MDHENTRRFVDETWERSVLPVMTEYMRVPNKSPMFDRDWQANGHMDRALDLIAGWSGKNAPPDATLSVERLPDRTPLLLIDVPGKSQGCVLLYGHYDKQPEMTGWREGLGPWTPVLEGERLYGRGGADDGYATFASITALKALREQGVDHARCVALIEGCEESGSYDLPYYLEAMSSRIDMPDLVICLDSGCGNYEQLWGTTSLRGIVSGNLSVSLLREGVHSGDGSGVIASSFRVLRQLLSRIEDEHTGEILVKEMHVEVPAERLEEADRLASILGDDFVRKYPTLRGVKPAMDDLRELILNRTWRPALSITGAEGLPPLESAGNVLRPFTSVKLSMRIPPTCDAVRATARLKQVLEAGPPYGAHVHFEPDHEAAGWNAPRSEPWLSDAIDEASRAYFGREAAYMGEGGSIPFMAMLSDKFPAAQFLITGLLGPGANAHGPNEFLHIPTAKKLTCSVASIIAAHAARK